MRNLRNGATKKARLGQALESALPETGSLDTRFVGELFRYRDHSWRPCSAVSPLSNSKPIKNGGQISISKKGEWEGSSAPTRWLLRMTGAMQLGVSIKCRAAYS